ncbi:MAG: protein kinase, partial [Acidobacteriaceae bacterium]|nr:protein kinase [Acidobacteriaceae bacterium]
MGITDQLVLPADTLLIPVTELAEDVRRQFEAGDGDYALTRPHSRTPSRVIDGDAARLLEEFRKPSTVAEAIIRFSKSQQLDPDRTLEDAFPMIQRLVLSRLLVEADSRHALKIEPLLREGTLFAGVEVLQCVQAVEDTDLYRVQLTGGGLAALKLLRPVAHGEVERMFEREAHILTHLNGSVSPKLLSSGIEDDRHYLLMEWCAGEDCSTVATGLRQLRSRDLLHKMGATILDAYAELHSRKVLHSDIHPRNVLVDRDQSVNLIDFGLARLVDGNQEFRRARRGGVGFYFEPEYAEKVRTGHRPPASTELGEQFAVAALLYSLISGRQYVDFSLEKDEMLRQIAEDNPLPFPARGIDAWPALEAVLSKALAKKPSDRFPSLAEFAQAWKKADVIPIPGASDTAPQSRPAAFDKAQRQLDRMMARLQADRNLFASGLETTPRLSLTYGSAGIAYGLLRMACVREDPALLSLADLWAARATQHVTVPGAFYSDQIEITPEVVGKISPYHTASGIHAVQALIASAMGDVVGQQNALDEFIAAVNASECENLDVTLGRSGVLLVASLLLNAVSGNALVTPASLIALGDKLSTEIWSELQTLPPIREGRHIRYSGAAHGWCGILYALLCWSRSHETKLPVDFEERLVQLGALAQHVGRSV